MITHKLVLVLKKGGVMDRCENDHHTGERDNLVLDGRLYIMHLQGEHWSGPRWIGTEYYQRNPNHF